MVAKVREFEVPPDSELARFLDGASGLPAQLVKDGVHFEVIRKDEVENYEPDEARSRFRRYVGAWADVDADALIDQLYRAREEGSRPMERPTPLDID